MIYIRYLKEKKGCEAAKDRKVNEGKKYLSVVKLLGDEVIPMDRVT